MKDAVNLLLNDKDCQIQERENFTKKKNPRSLSREEKKFKETLKNIQNIKGKENLKKDKDIEELEMLMEKLVKNKNRNNNDVEKLLIRILQILKEEEISISKVLEKLKMKKEDLFNALRKRESLERLDKLVTELRKLIEVNNSKEKKLIIDSFSKIINGDNKELTKNDSKKEIKNNKTFLKEKNREIKEEALEKLTQTNDKENKSLEEIKLIKVTNLNEKSQNSLEKFKIREVNYDNRYNKKMISLGEEKFKEFSKDGLNGEFKFFNRELFKVSKEDLKDPLTNKVQRQELIAEVMQKIKVYLKKGYSEMRLSLKPESLGELNLKLAMKNKTLMAKFTVENSAVEEIIESSLDQLKDSFASLGIDFEEIKVTVGLKGEEQFLEEDERRKATRKDLKKDEEVESLKEIMDNEDDWQPFWLAKVIDCVA